MIDLDNIKMNASSTHEVSLEQLLKDGKISQQTFDKATIAKKYIERKYNLKNTKNTEWNNLLKKIIPQNKNSKNV